MPSFAFNLDLATIVQAFTAGLLVYGGKVLHGTSVAVAKVETRLDGHEQLDDKRFEYVEARLSNGAAASRPALDS